MYFDRGFLAQGLPLWRLRAKHDSDSVRWVLALAEFTPDALREVGGMWLRVVPVAEVEVGVVPVAEVEVGDAELAAAKANRTRGGDYFTLSPCWPRRRLAKRPDIGRVTDLDADLFLFGSPEPISMRWMEPGRARR